MNGCLGRAGLANFETILSGSIQNSYLIWQILQRYTHTVLRKAGYQLFFCLLQKREVLLIVRLNQQLILPSHLSFALLLLSQVHVYCLFFPHPFLFISSRFFSWAQSVMLRWLLFLFAQSHVCKIPFICLLFSLLFLITALLFASSSYGFINTM